MAKKSESTELNNEMVVANRNALAVYSKIQNPIEACRELGKFISQSGMCGAQSEPQGAVIAMSCLCDGITPLEFGRRYHVIKGNVTMRSDRMLAELRGRGGKYKVKSRSSDKAEIEITYDGETASFSMTHDEAKGENFYYQKDGKKPKDNWSTPRGVKQMLWARVVSDGIRTMCPEIVAGVYTPEETIDFTGDDYAEFTHEAVTVSNETVTASDDVAGGWGIDRESAC